MTPLGCFGIVFGLPFLLLVGGFIFLVLKLLKKQKDIYWIGEIIDKKTLQHEDKESDRTVTDHMIIVRTEEGKEVKAGLSRQMYESLNIGDMVEKKVGSFYPVKVEPKS